MEALLGKEPVMGTDAVRTFIKGMKGMDAADKPNAQIIKAMRAFVKVPSVSNARKVERYATKSLPTNKGMWSAKDRHTNDLKQAVQEGLESAVVSGDTGAQALANVKARFIHYKEVFKDNKFVQDVAMNKDPHVTEGIVKKLAAKGKYAETDMKAMQRALWEETPGGKQAWSTLAQSMVGEVMEKIFSNPRMSDVMVNAATQLTASRQIVAGFNNLGMAKIAHAFKDMPKEHAKLMRWYNGAKQIIKKNNPSSTMLFFAKWLPTNTIHGRIGRLAMVSAGAATVSTVATIGTASVLGVDLREWFTGGGAK